MRLSDSGCIDRATCMCYIPLGPPYTYQETAPLSLFPSLPAVPPYRRPLTANRPSSIHERGTAVLPLSSSSPPPPPSPPCFLVYMYILIPAPVPHRAPVGNQPLSPAGLYVMSKCCEIIARKSDWQQTRNSSTRDARAARGGTGIWVRG